MKIYSIDFLTREKKKPRCSSYYMLIKMANAKNTDNNKYW